MIPEWEVEVFPGGPTVILNGTVEEVREELLKLNPDWDEQYLIDVPKSNSSTLAQRTTDSTLAGRANFDGASYFCRNRWQDCSATAIYNGIHYLRGITGQPTNGPGPGNCGRVSCSYHSAIWWCNDVS